MNRAKNLACLVDGAVVQIERAVCDKGAVVVNMKNVLDHEKLRKCVFSSWEHGGAALQAQIESVIQQFYATEADLLRSKFENKSSVAPIVILIAHATVLCYPPGSLKKTFTELKSMTALTLPDRRIPAPGTFGAEAVCLAQALNHIVQTAL